jgi:hypothetical protein
MRDGAAIMPKHWEAEVWPGFPVNCIITTSFDVVPSVKTSPPLRTSRKPTPNVFEGGWADFSPLM